MGMDNKKAGSRRTLWERLRSHFDHFLFPSMRELFVARLHDPVKEMPLPPQYLYPAFGDGKCERHPPASILFRYHQFSCPLFELAYTDVHARLLMKGGLGIWGEPWIARMGEGGSNRPPFRGNCTGGSGK